MIRIYGTIFSLSPFIVVGGFKLDEKKQSLLLKIAYTDYLKLNPFDGEENQKREGPLFSGTSDIG